MSSRTARPSNRQLAANLPPYPVTPDGRYFVVRGRLWRMSNPALGEQKREILVRDLMAARRNRDRAEVDRTKRALGERGPPWWDDGAEDFNRRMARNSPYANWFESVSPELRATDDH